MAKSDKRFDDKLAKLEEGIKEEQAKTKPKKKEKEMKNLKENSTLKTIVTVTLTLIAVATIAASFLAGMNYQKGLEADKNEAVSQAIELKLEAVEQ